MNTPHSPPFPQGAEGEAGKDGQPAQQQSGGGAPGSGTGGGFGDDLSWTKDAEPILDTHLGEGASVFRADSVSDASGRLGAWWLGPGAALVPGASLPDLSVLNPPHKP